MPTAPSAVRVASRFAEVIKALEIGRYYLFTKHSDGSLEKINGPYHRLAEVWISFSGYDTFSKKHMIVGQVNHEGIQEIDSSGYWVGDTYPKRVIWASKSFEPWTDALGFRHLGVFVISQDPTIP